MVYIFLADGFEESEALLPADILKRAGLDVCLVSITADKLVASSHGFKIMAPGAAPAQRPNLALPLPSALRRQNAWRSCVKV